MRTQQDRRAKTYLKQHLKLTKDVFFLSVEAEIYGLNLGDAHTSLAEQGIDPSPCCVPVATGRNENRN